MRRAIAAFARGDLAQAEKHCRTVLELEGEHFNALHLLGIIACHTGRLSQAADVLARAVALNPQDAIAQGSLGSALLALKRPAEALERFRSAVAIKPDLAEAHNNLGIALRDLARAEESLESFDRAIALKPDLADAHYNRGVALTDLNRPSEAVRSFDRAIAHRPDHVDAHNNRGAALRQLRRPEEALKSFERAISLRPNYAEAYRNRGIALHELGQLEAAVASYDRAIALRPDYAEAYAERGDARTDLKQPHSAARDLAKALELVPDYDFIPGMLLYLRMSMCDWRTFDMDVTAVEVGIANRRKVSPSFPVMAMFDSPVLHRQAAEILARDKCPSDPVLGPIAPISSGDKIRVGYFSADFGEHPVSYLMAGVFETHDRSRFAISGFSFSANEPDPMTRRVAAAMDHFIDVRRQSDREVASIARERRIEIAIDLGGFTHGCRPGIFALRAAPIQASYLGYLGTMGVDWMDYLLADDVIIPPQSRSDYAEKIAYLPSYQANDDKRVISERPLSRADFGFPASSFVFCTLNANYKITPETFGSWMRILEHVEGSVLLLLADNAEAVANLRREAVARGVAAERLIFAGRLPRADYIARYRLADLFLDTLPYNAGTTASDALWSGLPVLTLAGESFPSRVAASVLTAVGLPELITISRKDYERAAMELATNPEKLASVRQKLAANRLTTPLFDTGQFTRNLEAVYEAMVARYRADLPPDHISIRR